MNKKLFISVILLPAVWLCACSNMFYTPLRITASSPSQAVYAAGDNPEVWVEFSATVDGSLAEQAFTLSKDSSVMTGRFSWSGNRLTFTPYEAFATGHTYILKVATSIEDRDGNSLQEEFIFRFRFGSDTVRPTIIDAVPATPGVDCDPYDHEVLGASLPADLYHPITVVFSEPVDPASFYDAFSLSPSITGGFSWTAADTVVFTPAEPYQWQTEYKISVTTGVRDLEGNAMADPYASFFFIGTDRTPPAVTAVTSVIPAPARQGETAAALTENNVTSGWESDWEITVQFSEAVTEASVQTRISFTPAWDYRLVYEPAAPDRVVLKRSADANRFRYGQVYTMLIEAGVADAQGNATTRADTFHFNVNGVHSRPPAVYQTCYMADSTHTPFEWVTLSPLDILTIGSGAADGIFDFYLNCAERVTVPAAAFAENFGITYENNCLGDVAYTKIEIINQANAAAASPPLPTGVTLSAAQIVVRLYVKLVDNASCNGSITLAISKDLCDQALDNILLHNPMAEDWSLRLRDSN